MRSTANIAVRFTGVSKHYGTVRALQDMNFEVEEGRFFVLFGPSSVGKTTTLRMIAGLTPADAGRVELFGKDWTHEPIKGRGVSMVFQSFALYPHLTVFENFAYPLREEGVAEPEVKSRVEDIGAMLKLSNKLDRKPNTLSGGEQQRVALGRSLIRRPKILLLDEPLTNLDAKLRHDMRAELKRLHRQFGLTIIYATPDELEALSMGEEIAVMRDGAIVQRGTPDALYEQPANTYVASKIGAPHMNMIRARFSKDGRSIETALGKFPSRKGIKGPAGAQVLLGIRPSDIVLAEKSARRIKSKVHLLEPLGDVTIVSFEASGEMLRVVLPESQAQGLRPGDSAGISFDPKKIHVFNASDGQAIA